MPRKYRLTRPRRPIDLPHQARPTALVWVDREEYEEDGPLCLEGDATLLERIRAALRMSYGGRGRPLDGQFSPMDLAVALDAMPRQAFEPEELA